MTNWKGRGGTDRGLK